MNPLQATVEIVKAAIASANSAGMANITDEKYRAEFLLGIEELYKKLLQLYSGT